MATPSREVAEQVAKRIWRENERAVSGGNGFTLADLRAGYLAWVAENIGPKSAEYVRVDLATRPFMENPRRQCDKFGPLDLKRIMENGLANGLARATANARAQAIKRAFRWAVENNRLPALAAYALSTVRMYRVTDAKQITSVPWPVVVATMEVMPQVLRDMVTVQALTGMRSGEICGMRRADIDGDIYNPPQHKGRYKGKKRFVLIGPRAAAILAGYAERPAEVPIFSPAEAQAQRSNHAVAGDRYDSHSYRRAIWYAVRQARKLGTWLPDWHPHQLRHLAATAADTGLDLLHAQAMLGHSSAQVTELYRDADIKRARKVAQLIG